MPGTATVLETCPPVDTTCGLYRHQGPKMSAAGLEVAKRCMMRKEKPALNREKQEYQLFGQLTLKTKKHNSHFKMDQGHSNPNKCVKLSNGYDDNEFHFQRPHLKSI